MRLVFPCMLLMAILAADASAQPGKDIDLTRASTAAKAAAPGQSSPFHAVPPLPYDLSAPLQTLPPPTRAERDEGVAGDGAQVLQRPGYTALMLDDGRLVFDRRLLDTGISNDPSVGPRLFGAFDLTDMLSPQDPYLSDKLELLHQTFAQRVTMREEHNQRVMDRALAALPSYLQEIWHYDAWDAATKRHILFALWDECAESGDETLASGGQAARLQIEDFIRATLPAGSDQGFSVQELRAFNQSRTSLAKFAP